MYVTPTNRAYRAKLAQSGIAPRTILAAPTKAQIQRAARAWTAAVHPDRSSMRLNVCHASTHTVLKQYRFRPTLLQGGGDPELYRAVFESHAADLAATYHVDIQLTDVEEQSAQGQVTLRYTVRGTAYDMQQPLDTTEYTNNNTILRQLEAVVQQSVCQDIVVDQTDLPQKMDQTEAGEETTRVQCASNQWAVLTAGQEPQFVSSDPLAAD